MAPGALEVGPGTPGSLGSSCRDSPHLPQHRQDTRKATLK